MVGMRVPYVTLGACAGAVVFLVWPFGTGGILAHDVPEITFFVASPVTVGAFAGFLLEQYLGRSRPASRKPIRKRR